MILDRDAVVRGYLPGDETGVQEAFSEVFGHSRRLAEWRWKFEAPPCGSRIVLAFDAAGRVVCQYAAIAVEVSWFGEHRLAGQIVDVLSRGRAALGRRGGPFLRTVETFLAQRGGRGDLDFIFGFPGERHQRLGELGGLYNETVAMELLLADPRVPRAPSLAASRGSWRSPGWVEGFDATALARLWERASHRYRAGAVRDDRWFSWRYAARPGADYEQFGLRRRGELRAWAVLSGTGSTARWVDLLWDGESGEDLAALAEELLRRSVERGAEKCELWLRGDIAARETLLASGFAPTLDPERRLSAIALAPGIDLAAIFESFYLTLGDSDHV